MNNAAPTALPAALRLAQASQLPAPALLRLTMLLPVLDEAGNILPLTEEMVRVLDGDARTRGVYEILFVDDGSTDATREEIAQAATRWPQANIRLVRHPKRLGKSQGLRHGMQAAHGRWIIAIDGDGQNDPADIPAMLTAAWGADGRSETATLVNGVRVKRYGAANRRWASRFANQLRRAILKDDSPDTGCGFKMYPRDAHLMLPYFDQMHRYEPVLFKLFGYPTAYVPINDRARLHGQSKYTNWGRAVEGVVDLLGVLWLQRRHRGRLAQPYEVPLANNAASRDRAAS